jgi:two-component system phosphate regulon sensor histidine kinase PhoR
MKKSLFFKIFLGFFIFTSVITVSILLFSFNSINNHYTNTVADDLEKLGSPLLLTITPLLEKENYNEIDNLVESIGRETGTRITIITTDGKVVADSESDPALMDNHKNRPEIIQALDGKVGSSKRYSATMKENMLYIALPIESNGKIMGVLRLSRFLKNLKELISNLKFKIILFSLALIAFSLLIATLFSNKLLKPVRELSEAAKRVAQGDFNTKVFLKNRDELKDLADNYNYMTDEINKYVKELSLQKEELHWIITSMRPGLLVIDKNENILLCNESLENIVHAKNIKGEKYWKVFKEPKLLELVQMLFREKGNVIEDIQMDKNYYQVSAAYLETINETVLVFHDITQIKNLENIKRDFVQNVSHELRTPLTAIKGYAETIESVDKETAQYLDIIKRHTNRLINIVEDLLILSELESGGDLLEKEKVKIPEILDNVIKIFKDQINKKGLEIHTETDKNLQAIYGDSLRLEQVFINLIDNAIKYTEHGAISITIKRIDRNIEIRFKDTGIGIPQKHLTRIFERFYTVDKSRSRQLGGTGLGLSIVKHIIQLHGGSIDVQSSPGSDSTFIILLPISVYPDTLSKTKQSRLFQEY